MISLIIAVALLSCMLGVVIGHVMTREDMRAKVRDVMFENARIRAENIRICREHRHG